MRSTEPPPRRFAGWLCVLGLTAAVAAAAAVDVRATYGAQTTADEPQYLLSALSLAEDGDLDIADELADRRWRNFHKATLPEQTRPLADGRRVSPHDPLLPLYLAVPMRLGGWQGAKVAVAVLAGVLASLTAWTAVRRFGVRSRTALVLTALFSLSVPLAPYGTQVYPEVPAALCATAALAAITGRLQRGGCWLLTTAVVALPWLAVKYAPVAAVLAGAGLLRLLRDRRRRQALAVAGSLLAAGAVFVGIHLVVWEGFTAYASGDHFVGGEFTAVGNRPNYAGRARRIVGLLVDREFGIAAWQPAWLLVVPSLGLLARRPPAHWTPLWCTLSVGWLNATFVALTMHGYWFPGRQMVVVLPLAVIAIAVAADRGWRLFAAAVVSGAIGVWSYAWLVVEGLGREITWVVDFYDVDDPWYQAWASILPGYRYATPATTSCTRHGASPPALRCYSLSDSADAEPLDEDEAELDADPDAELDPPSSMVRTPAPSSAPHAVRTRTPLTAATAQRTRQERDNT